MRDQSIAAAFRRQHQINIEHKTLLHYSYFDSIEFHTPLTECNAQDLGSIRHEEEPLSWINEKSRDLMKALQKEPCSVTLEVAKPFAIIIYSSTA